jgi:hypothetical protein
LAASWSNLHRLSRLTTFAVAALAFVLLSLAGPGVGPSPVSATGDVDGQQAHAVGFVYVNDNTPGTNTVAGFARKADGSLTALSGSPFPAGGSGTGAAVPSQGGVQVSSDGHLLLVADAGSNQISVLRIGGDGSLSPVSGSPFSSDGSTPVSIAVQDHTVFVANTGNAGTLSTDCSYKTGDGSNYTGFRLDGNGQLTALANSTYCVPPGSELGDVVLNADGSHLSGSRVNPSLIDSLDVDRHGELTVSPGSPFPAQGVGPFGSAFSPTHPDDLFVSNAHNGGTAGTVSAFTVGENAVLTSIGASPFPDNQTAPCWVAITDDGRFLFASNTGSGSVSSYAVANDGSLSLLSSTTLHGGGGNTDLGVGASGKALYVLHGTAVNVMAIQNGATTELGSPVPLPAGATPFGLAVA